MLNYSCLRLASKVTAGNARNHAGTFRKKAKLFHVIPGTPVTPAEKLKEQRYRFGQDRLTRRPEFLPGRNVRMDPSTYTLYATVKGVVSIRTSSINPSYKWLDVEPDIQKVRQSGLMRTALDRQERASYLVPQNLHYKEEWDTFREKNWRERVMKTIPATERFKDPNLFTRGVVPVLEPLNHYYYE